MGALLKELKVCIFWFKILWQYCKYLSRGTSEYVYLRLHNCAILCAAPVVKAISILSLSDVLRNFCC